MSVIFFTFVFFLFIVMLMAVGYIVAGKSIKGSCGGLNAIEGLKGACDICEGKSQCSKRRRMMIERAKQMNVS